MSLWEMSICVEEFFDPSFLKKMIICATLWKINSKLSIVNRRIYYCLLLFTIPFLSAIVANDAPHFLWGDGEVAKKIYCPVENPWDNGCKSLPIEKAVRGTNGLGATERKLGHGPKKRSCRPCKKKDRTSDHEFMRAKLLQTTDCSWNTQETTAIEAENCNDPIGDLRSPLQQKLDKITIPRICFHGVPLRDGIDAIGELAEKFDHFDGKGINLIVLDEPGEEEKIYLTLRNVSLGKILQRIAQSVGYDCEVEEDAVVLTSAEKNSKRLITQFFPISRATVVHLTNLRMKVAEGIDREQLRREEDLLRIFLQNAGIDFAHIPGSSLAFDGRQLIVTQTPKNLRHINEILSHYAKIRQVEIEAKFIEVQEGILDELQFRWSAANDHGSAQTGSDSSDSLRTMSQAFTATNTSHGDGKITIGGDYLAKPEIISIPNHAPTPPNLANLSGNIVPLVDVISIISGTHIGNIMHAVEQHSGSDLMSAPKVTVLSGKTAEIVVAQEMRYPEDYDEIQSAVGSGSNLTTSTSAGVTITAGTPRNFKTRNIGVEMTVTPFVENDGKITLQLEPTVTEFEGYVEYGGVSVAVAGGTTVTVPSGFFQPVFTTRKIRTEVTIENGATVIMGGLTREEIKSVRDKVPILGNIPVFGKLFQSNGKSSQKRNLLIFVTARLVDPQGTVRGEIIQPDCPCDRRGEFVEKKCHCRRLEH
ncbi:MAG: hypothetical protein LBI69_04025 [Puniceicoccales bacterium]|jgi:general secretion pathway protein D|nr:hypothetical protein [Puniceicoccales bacterium]